jgi:N-acyl-D-aspartate/D-glutamate deacylase
MSEENLERFLGASQVHDLAATAESFAVRRTARKRASTSAGAGDLPASAGAIRYGSGRYSRWRRAVDKMSGMPARRLKLRGRGKIAVGAWADLVLFDPATVEDKATFADPFQYPAGIPTVVVNGRIALRMESGSGREMERR